VSTVSEDGKWRPVEWRLVEAGRLQCVMPDCSRLFKWLEANGAQKRLE